MALTLFAQSGKQREYKKKLQFSVFPGISTNGIQSGFYINNFSFNLFGGLSGFNRFLEIGLITNSNIHGTTGIQLAGMANIIGTNAFLNMTQTEEWKMINDGYESNTQGIQVAGLLNYVRTHVTGIQVAGALNVVGRDFNGVQVAGVGNSSAGYAIGFQGAGFYNIAHQFMIGVQITTLFNYTDGQLSGTQLALVNKAKQTMGKNSTPFTLARSLQLGLLNFSKAMHGTQVGLINFGGETRGNQFGLINFFNRNKTKENVDAGVPIGLLNIGSRGSVFRFTTNDFFFNKRGVHHRQLPELLVDARGSGRHALRGQQQEVQSECPHPGFRSCTKYVGLWLGIYEDTAQQTFHAAHRQIKRAQNAELWCPLPAPESQPGVGQAI